MSICLEVFLGGSVGKRRGFMLSSDVLAFVDHAWETSILPEIERYIRIPAKSPHFDPDWKKNGHIDEAVGLIERWCRAQDIPGLKTEVLRLEGRTPLLFMEIPGAPSSNGGDDTVMLYGHFDKQPEMSGWAEGLTPWTPVRKDDKLFGRGGADDGYSAFASLLAVRAAKKHGG